MTQPRPSRNQMGYWSLLEVAEWDGSWPLEAILGKEAYLGFKQQSFYKGSHWSWTSFNENMIQPKTFEVMVHDIHALESQTHVMKRLSDEATGAVIATVKPPSERKLSLVVTVTSKELVIRVYDKDKYLLIQFDDGIADALLIEPFHILKPEEHLKVIPLDANGEGLKMTEKELMSTINTEGNLQNQTDYKKYLSFKIYLSTLQAITSPGVDKTAMDFIELPQKTNFTTPRQFLRTLNSKSQKYKYKFSFSPTTARFHLVNNGNLCLRMSESLASILGFEAKDDYVFCEELYKATHPPLLHRGINHLFIYSNIVDSVLVGNSKAPLLLVCAFKESNHGMMIHQEFLNPTFVPITHSSIHQIDVLICNDVGEPIPFLYGKTVLTLQFRKRQNL